MTSDAEDRPTQLPGKGSFSQEIRQRIESEYRRLDYSLGWRFLASPEQVLEQSSIAFIGLNPGGSKIDSEHPDFAPQFESAYSSECWAGHPPGASPLQKQVLALFEALGVEARRVLAGNLVPFRSPDWESLLNKDAAVSFGKALWRDVLRRARPKLIVTIGSLAFDSCIEISGSGHVFAIPAGWGKVAIRYSESAEVRIVGLPHLSRFGLIGRPESEVALAIAFGEYWSRN